MTLVMVHITLQMWNNDGRSSFKWIAPKSSNRDHVLDKWGIIYIKFMNLVVPIYLTLKPVATKIPGRNSMTPRSWAADKFRR